ncbi:MAG: hypothetical protein AAGB10_08650 [Pseudomonadota bacterium]
MRFAILGLGLVMACTSPPPRFVGETPQVVSVGRNVFDVYLEPDQAFLVRTNRRAVPDAASVFAAAAVAAEQASGCVAQAGKVTGDQAMIRVPLRCG